MLNLWMQNLYIFSILLFLRIFYKKTENKDYFFLTTLSFLAEEIKTTAKKIKLKKRKQDACQGKNFFRQNKLFPIWLVFGSCVRLGGKMKNEQ